jgi:succinate dehydrogenase / fumarate reductase cytochrome b subunit
MADVNRGNRPLSPHLSIYNQSYTGTLSILHRLTGVAMTLGAVLIVWWLLAAATGPAAFATADGFLTSLLGRLILIGSLWALSYHLLNGVRHLFWDAGYGFNLGLVRTSGWVVVIGSVVLTALVWLIS